MSDVLSASAARAGLFRLIDQTAEDHRPIVITGKRNSAVLVSKDDYSAMQETLYLLSIPGMRESLIAARAAPVGNAKAFAWPRG